MSIFSSHLVTLEPASPSKPQGPQPSSGDYCEMKKVKGPSTELVSEVLSSTPSPRSHQLCPASVFPSLQNGYNIAQFELI